MAYPNTFLSDLSIYNAKAAVVIKNLSLEGRTEEAILLSTLKSTANDISLSDGVRLDALTALINQGRLLDYALAPYFPSVITYANSQTYTGLHNELSGLNTGDFYHLTYSEYLKLVNLPNGLSVQFSDILGPVSGNTNLQNALNTKEDFITTGSANRFFAWDKTWKDIDYAYIINTPTTLAGLGISASDTLFDGKYLQPSTVISSYTIGTNTAISNTDTLFGALGKIQGQINSIGSSNGTINYVGILVPSGFFLDIGNSPLTGSGGDISITLASQLQNTVFAAPYTGNGIPSFRLLDATDLPASGVTPDTYGDASNYPIIQVDAYGRVTSVGLQLASGTGTVQSVDVTMPSEFAFNGGPVTTNGIINFTWDNQAAGLVLASPETSSGTPAFRALIASDIPDIAISQVTNLQAALNNNANLNTLPNAQLFIGNASSRPQPRSINGVITIDNEGTTYPVDNSIPLTALEHINDFTLLGRLDSPAGEVQVVGLSPTDFVIDVYGNLSLASPVAPSITAPGQLLSYNAAGTPPGQAALAAPLEGQILIGYPTRPAPDEFGLIWVTPSGVIDNIATDGTVTLADNSIGYEKLLDSASANVLLGVGGLPGAITALNSADATAILDSFGGSTKGLVPGGSGGDPTKFLSGAGTWITVSGGGGTTTNALLIDDIGLGDASGITFDGSAAVTISYNTVGAPKANGTGASGTWGISITGNAANVTGIVSLANGGTNANLTASAGSVAYSSSSAIQFTSVATQGGQLLQAAATTTNAPVWTTATYPSTTVKDKILYSSANNIIGEIAAPTVNNTFLKWNGGIFSWDTAGSGSGTVTSGGNKELAYYDAPGTTVQGLPVSVSNGTFFLSQTITAGTPANPAWTATTGSGSVVLSTSPSLTTPSLGVATATSINGLSLTALATGFSVAGGTTSKTLTMSNTLTFSGTDGSSIAFGAGGTVAYIGTANSWVSGVKQTFAPSATTAGINVGTLAGQPSVPVNGDLVYNSTATALQAYINGAWVSLGAGGGSGTVNSASLGAIAYYAATGTAVSGSTTGYWDNTNGRINIGAATAPNARVQVSAGTASIPHLLLSPVTAIPSGTTAGSIWYYESAGTEYLALYKTTAATQTKILTKDRNPDFVTSSTSGVIVSDANGTLTKSADLTALGIYAQTNDVTVVNTTTPTTLIGTVAGSATLPANFFAAGKTIIIFISGTYAQTSGSNTCTLNFSIGGVAIGSIALQHGNSQVATYFEARIVATCRTAGASGTVQYQGCGLLNLSGTPEFYYIIPATSGSINTTTTNAINVTATWSAANASNSLVAGIHTAQYIN